MTVSTGTRPRLQLDPAVGAAGTYAQPWRVWAQATRVRSLMISTIAVAAGAAAAFADGYTSWRILVAWLGAVSIQAGTNLMNVANNYKTGRGRSSREDPRGSSAPVRNGALTPEQVRAGALGAFGLGIVAGLFLALLCGWPILAIGVPAVLTGYFYGAPPLRLAYRGLGVIAVFVFMGPVMVVGSYDVVALHASLGAVLVSIPVGLLAAAIMHTNDLRDFADDVENGKRTLSTLIGRDAAVRLLEIMVVTAYVILATAIAARLVPWTTLAAFLSLPAAWRLLRPVHDANDDDALFAAWFRGVDLHARFGMLLIVGLLLSRIVKL